MSGGHIKKIIAKSVLNFSISIQIVFSTSHRFCLLVLLFFSERFEKTNYYTTCKKHASSIRIIRIRKIPFVVHVINNITFEFFLAILSSYIMFLALI